MKPCPFCGSTSAFVKKDASSRFVKCHNCEARGPIEPIFPFPGSTFATPEQRWDQRTPEPTPQPSQEPQERPTCKTCPFWNQVPFDNLPKGICQIKSTANPHSKWGDDWCGEHPDFPNYIQQRNRTESR